MKTTMKNKPINDLTVNVLESCFEDFDEQTVTHAKNRIIDVIGCLIGGANANGNLALVDLIREWGGNEEATILVHGGKAPAHNVAMVNSIMSRSYDFEPVDASADSVVFPAHISGTTTITALAMGELKNINGKELITAMLVGDDIAARVLAASGFSFSLGWDCIGTVNAFGATAIAGRLLGLDSLQMRNAFGIVLNQLAGSFQNIWDGTDCFKLPQGISARNGIFSAQLAKKGWTGPEDGLLSEFGYYHLYTEGCSNPEILTKELGNKYFSDVTFKPYPCCRMTHPAIDCALTFVRKHGINADDIKTIKLYVSRGAVDSFVGRSLRSDKNPHANAIFSYQYTVANALLRQSVRPEHFSDESLNDPRVYVLARKVKLEELPMASDPRMAKLRIITKDGREYTEFTNAPKGDPFKNPMSGNDILAKFRLNVEFSKTVAKKSSEKALDLMQKLEQLDDVNVLVKLLVT